MVVYFFNTLPFYKTSIGYYLLEARNCRFLLQIHKKMNNTRALLVALGLPAHFDVKTTTFNACYIQTTRMSELIELFNWRAQTEAQGVYDIVLTMNSHRVHAICAEDAVDWNGNAVVNYYAKICGDGLSTISTETIVENGVDVVTTTAIVGVCIMRFVTQPRGCHNGVQLW